VHQNFGGFGLARIANGFVQARFDFGNGFD
jgi:hypothetical protein